MSQSLKPSFSLNGSTYLTQRSKSKHKDHQRRRDRLQPLDKLTPSQHDLPKSATATDKATLLNHFLRSSHEFSHNPVRLNRRSKRVHACPSTPSLGMQFETISPVEQSVQPGNSCEVLAPVKIKLPVSFASSCLADSTLFDKELLSLRLPSGRQGALGLKGWLEQAESRCLKEGFEAEELVYTAAFKECVRQIGCQCIDRAHLLKEVVERLSLVWKSKGPEYQRQLKLEQKQYERDLKNVNTTYNRKLNKLTDKLCEVRTRQAQETIRTLQVENKQLSKSHKAVEDHRSHSAAATTDAAVMANALRDLSNDAVTQTDRFNIEISQVLNFEQRSDCSNSTEERPYVKPPDFDTLLDQPSVTAEEVEQALSQVSAEWRVGYEHGLALSKKLILQTSCEVQTDQEGALLSVNWNRRHSEVYLKADQTNDQSARSRSNSRQFLKSAVSKIIHYRMGRSHEKSAALRLIAHVASMTAAKLEGYATMPKKDIQQKICALYHSAMSKFKHFEQTPAVGAFVYEELVLKNGNASSAAKKLKRLLASSARHFESIRIKLFLRAVGAGRLVCERDLAMESSIIALRCYHSLLTSHSGVPSSEAPASALFALPKALDCVKEVLEPFLTRNISHVLHDQLEALCVEDPNKLSKMGFIDLDLFVQTVVSVYEEYRDGILEGVAQVFSDFVGVQMLIRRDEFALLVKCMYPHEHIEQLIQQLNARSDEVITELTDQPELYYSREVVNSFCIHKRLFSIYDFNRFVNLEGYEDSLDTLQQQVEDTAQALFATGSVLSRVAWEDKLSYAREAVESNNLAALLLLYRIMVTELACA